MQPVHCAGTLKTGRLAGKPCRKFFGNLTKPYQDVICPRCGHKNLAPLKPGDIYEWTDESPECPYLKLPVFTAHPIDGFPGIAPIGTEVRTVVLKAERWQTADGRSRWAWVVQT